jgi:hypothetical protein
VNDQVCRQTPMLGSVAAALDAIRAAADTAGAVPRPLSSGRVPIASA